MIMISDLKHLILKTGQFLHLKPSVDKSPKYWTATYRTNIA